MELIVAEVRGVNELLQRIGENAREHADGIGQVSDAVSQLDQVTQANAALADKAPPPPKACVIKPSAWLSLWLDSNWRIGAPRPGLPRWTRASLVGPRGDEGYCGIEPQAASGGRQGGPALGLVKRCYGCVMADDFGFAPPPFNADNALLRPQALGARLALVG